jgi:prepilin-type processing-associated H-X9-DG protein
MQGASFYQARMKGAQLQHARMEGADLYGTVMDNATELRAVTFHCAALRSIDLGDVKITQDQVNAAFADGSVTLPEWFVRPGHWPTWVLQDAGEHSFRKELEKWRDDPANYNPPPPSP